MKNAGAHKTMFALFTLFMVLWGLEADRRTQLSYLYAEDRKKMKKIGEDRAAKIRWIGNTIKRFIIWMLHWLITGIT